MTEAGPEELENRPAERSSTEVEPEGLMPVHIKAEIRGITTCKAVEAVEVAAMVATVVPVPTVIKTRVPA